MYFIRLTGRLLGFGPTALSLPVLIQLAFLLLGSLL